MYRCTVQYCTCQTQVGSTYQESRGDTPTQFTPYIRPMFMKVGIHYVLSRTLKVLYGPFKLPWVTKQSSIFFLLLAFPVPCLRHALYPVLIINPRFVSIHNTLHALSRSPYMIIMHVLQKKARLQSAFPSRPQTTLPRCKAHL